MATRNRFLCGWCLGSPPVQDGVEGRHKAQRSASKAAPGTTNNTQLAVAPSIKRMPLSDGLNAICDINPASISVVASVPDAHSFTNQLAPPSQASVGSVSPDADALQVVDMLPVDGLQQWDVLAEGDSTEGGGAASAIAAAPTKGAVAASPAPVQTDASRSDTDDVKPYKQKGRRAESPPPSPPYKAPSRASLRPPLTGDLATAIRNLEAVQPENPVADLTIIRAAAVHSKEVLELHLPSLVPLLLRTMRAPRLSTARAAILAFNDMFITFGNSMAAHVADDTSPTSDVVLALMQKATGGDLQSKRIAGEANECLIAMVKSMAPASSINMLYNYCTTAKVHARVRSKAGTLVAAAAHRLAVQDIENFDQDLMVRCLRASEALLAGDAASCKAAEKLAVVVAVAFASTPRSPSKDGEDPWSNFLRLNLEPEPAAAVAGIAAENTGACTELLDRAREDVQILDELVSRIVLASE